MSEYAFSLTRILAYTSFNTHQSLKWIELLEWIDNEEQSTGKPITESPVMKDAYSL